jgi:prepilin-type N-terminal cleavage/methylation domain-containing protein
MTDRRVRHNSGFTLLEVLVALSILAIGASMALSLISGALGNIRKVQLRTRTIQHAETVMELSLLDDGIRQPTVLRGDFEDGTRWSLLVEDVVMPRPQALPQGIEMQQKILSYTVEVFAPDSQAPDLRLQTVKVLSTQQDLRTPATRLR